MDLPPDDVDDCGRAPRVDAPEGVVGRALRKVPADELEADAPMEGALTDIIVDGRDVGVAARVLSTLNPRSTSSGISFPVPAHNEHECRVESGVREGGTNWSGSDASIAPSSRGTQPGWSSVTRCRTCTSWH